MVIQVGDQIEQELRRLAGHQGRALSDVVEAALAVRAVKVNARAIR